MITRHVTAGTSQLVPGVLPDSLSLQEGLEGVLGKSWASYDQALDDLPVDMSSDCIIHLQGN